MDGPGSTQDGGKSVEMKVVLECEDDMIEWKGERGKSEAREENRQQQAEEE